MKIEKHEPNTTWSSNILKIEKSYLNENPLKMLRGLFILFDFGCHQTSNQLSCLFISVLQQTWFPHKTEEKLVVEDGGLDLVVLLWGINWSWKQGCLRVARILHLTRPSLTSVYLLIIPTFHFPAGRQLRLLCSAQCPVKYHVYMLIFLLL